MDVFARALVIANELLTNSELPQWKKERYASFDSGKGLAYEQGKLTLEDLRTYAIENGEPEMRSGKQELYEQLINLYI
jgi:xylose isomerase